MLDLLAFNMLVMVIACTIALMSCWAYDTIKNETEDGESQPAHEGSPGGQLDTSKPHFKLQDQRFLEQDGIRIRCDLGGNQCQFH
jgi:hypothetical protein